MIPIVITKVINIFVIKRLFSLVSISNNTSNYAIKLLMPGNTIEALIKY